MIYPYIDIGRKKVFDSFSDDDIRSCHGIGEIVINISDSCTRACKTCPHGNGYCSPHDFKNIELKTISKLCDDVGKRYTGFFSLSGFGEPLIHPNILEILTLIAEKCPVSHIILITNGDNIQCLKTFPMLKNLVIEYSMYDRLDKSEIENKFKDIDQIVYIKDINKNDIKLFNNKAGNIKSNCGIFKQENLPLKQQCFMPFYKVVIDINGDVLPCCCDWLRKKIFGNIMETNLISIWNNSEYNQFRQMLFNRDRSNHLCRTCNINGTIAGKNFVKIWKNLNYVE